MPGFAIFRRISRTLLEARYFLLLGIERDSSLAATSISSISLPPPMLYATFDGAVFFHISVSFSSALFTPSHFRLMIRFHRRHGIQASLRRPQAAASAAPTFIKKAINISGRTGDDFITGYIAHDARRRRAEPLSASRSPRQAF